MGVRIQNIYLTILKKLSEFYYPFLWWVSEYVSWGWWKLWKSESQKKTELIYEEANVTFMRVDTKLLSKIITKKYIFLFLASWRRLRYPSLLMSQYENPMILWTAVENFCNLGMLLSFYLYITLDILFIWTIKIIKYRLLVSSLSAMFSYCSVGRTG